MPHCKQRLSYLHCQTVIFKKYSLTFPMHLLGKKWLEGFCDCLAQDGIQWNTIFHSQSCSNFHTSSCSLWKMICLNKDRDKIQERLLVLELVSFKVKPTNSVSQPSGKTKDIPAMRFKLLSAKSSHRIHSIR